MYFQTVLSFALATLLETLTPGPTVALVFETGKSKGRKAARSVVVGIAAANFAGVLVVLLARVVVVSVPLSEVLKTFFRDIGAAYLTYLASRRILSSALRFITGADPVDPHHDKVMIRTGFLAHFLNPVTLPYYLSTFAAVSSHLSVGRVLLLGAIPVVFDLIVYERIATYSSRRPDIQIGHTMTAVVRLFGGLENGQFFNGPDHAPDALIHVAMR